MAKKRKKNLYRVTNCPPSDYNKLRQSAYELVVVQGYTQKAAAETLGVSEVSMSQWANEGGWKDLRRGRQATTAASTENLKQIITLLSGRRLMLEEQITEAMRDGDADGELRLRKEAASLSDEISKHNKTLVTVQKESRVTLGVYIDVMDDIFDQLRVADEALWEKTIEFQQTLIRKKSNELG